MGKPKNHKTRWTEIDEDLLYYYWGTYDHEWIANRLGRTASAIRYHALKMGLGDASGGRMTLRDAARKSGFSMPTLKQAAHRLGFYMRSRPTCRGSRPIYAIDSEHYDAIVAHLLTSENTGYCTTRTRAWGRCGKAESCLGCGTTERPHKAHNLCRRCWDRARRDGTLARYKPVGMNRAR